MYIVDSWGYVSLPASDVQAMVDTLVDAVARLEALDDDAAYAIAGQITLALALIIDDDTIDAYAGADDITLV